MDADNCGSANETNIKLYTDYDTVAQKWFIYQNGSGYNIASSYCDKVFDVAGSRDDAGTNVQFYTSNNTNAQIFSIYNIQNDGWTYQKPSAPSKPTVSTSVNAKTVTVSWSKAALNGKLDQREYDIRIYKNNTNNSAIFTKFGLTGTSYSYTLNDRGTYYVTIAAVNGSAKYSTIDAIPVTVDPNGTAGPSYNLGANVGSAPQKICAPINTRWPLEYTKISLAYSPFDTWVNMSNPAEWTNKMNPDKVY